MSSRFSPVEPLSAEHVVTGFDCGSPAQSVWLVEHALQAHRAGLSGVYVVGDAGHSDRRVIGYYALAAGSVAPADAPPRLRQGAGRDHQPVVILSRLGVDRVAQGAGLGRAWWSTRCAGSSRRPRSSDPMHLLLLMKDLRRALAE